MFGLINAMISALGELRGLSEIKLLEDLEPINRLIISKNVTEIQAQMDYLFDRLEEHQKHKKLSSTPDWLDEVVAYLDSHYHEPELSAGIVSEQFNINLSSLSRIFKKHRGVGLLDYIHKKRLDRAKELMKISDASVKDIAAKVGYYSSLTMIRAFKRYEGTTPGRFKEME